MAFNCSEDSVEVVPKWHINVTGHSFVGALATLLALELSSSHMAKTKEPTWNEDFTLNIKLPATENLQIAAWDANLVAPHKRMGNASISLETLCDGCLHEVSVELVGIGGGGKIHLEHFTEGLQVISSPSTPSSLDLSIVFVRTDMMSLMFQHHVQFPSVGHTHFRLQASLNEGEKREELPNTDAKKVSLTPQNEPGVLQKAWGQLKNYRIKPKVKYFGVTFTVEAAASALIIPESDKSNTKSMYDAGRAIFMMLLAFKKREESDEVLNTVISSWMDIRSLGIDTSMTTRDGFKNNVYPRMSLDVVNRWLSKLVVNHLNNSLGEESETTFVVSCGYQCMESSSFKDKARMLEDQTVFMQLEAIYHFYKLSREGLYDDALKKFSVMGFLTVDDPLKEKFPPLSDDVKVCIPGLLKLVRSCLKGATASELTFSVLATLDRLS